MDLVTFGRTAFLYKIKTCRFSFIRNEKNFILAILFFDLFGLGSGIDSKSAKTHDSCSGHHRFGCCRY